MTKTETAQLLTLVAAFDRRTLGETDVEAWYLIVADLEPNDCMEAVREHFLTERSWLMPADVRTRAIAASRRRAGKERLAELERQREAENPPAELTSRERPLLALMAGTPIKPVPRPVWAERRAALKRPIVQKPPFTAKELAAAQALFDEAARESEAAQ